MGNYASKLLFYTNESQKEYGEHQAAVQQATMEDNNMRTPISSEKRVLCDPRSVSTGITRTPIEVKYIPVGERKKIPNAIPKYLQKKQYLETDMDVVMPPLTPKKCPVPKSIDSDEQSDFIKVQDYLKPNVNVTKVITPIDKERFIILGLDPRSPAADFDRTPILMPKSLALIKARSQENLSRRGSYEMDIYNPKNSCQEIGASLNTPEIRLLSDTVSKSLKALDTEELPSTSLCDPDLSEFFKSEKEITVIENPKCMHEEKKSLVSDEQTVAIDNKEDKNEMEEQDDCENIESNTKVNDDKIKLWHDSLSSEENVSGKKNKKELPQEKASREDIIITFDKYTTVSTSVKPIKTKEDFREKRDTKGKKKNTKMSVELNEEKVFTPENKRGNEVHENRTPLGNRSNTQIQKKPQQWLRNKDASIGIQQENTPPHDIYNRKTRNGTQWDPNTTVLI